MAAKPAAQKKKYRLTGEIENSDFSFDEYVWAWSEAQAKMLIRRRLEKSHPRMVIYVLWSFVGPA